MILPIENEGRGNIFLLQTFFYCLVDKINDERDMSYYECILFLLNGFNRIFKRFFTFEILAFDLFQQSAVGECFFEGGC